VIHAVAPALHNAYLLEYIQQHAAQHERSKLAEELHDGVVQSLCGLELGLYSLVRRTAEQPELSAELKHLRAVAHEQLLMLRELIRPARTAEITAAGFVPLLSDFVERFGRDTHIRSRFLHSGNGVGLPDSTCSELVHIVQEALTNVRKHSQASALAVRLDCEQQRVRLVIQDNGRGADFAGELSLAEMDATQHGPAMIRQRVRRIGGNLVATSNPGRGMRLEITVPKEAHAVQRSATA
jgi:two-component system nitrate/nitrite sensor histidine kinase NarX